jgi:hypothetical protein
MPDRPERVRTQLDAAEENAICIWQASFDNGFPITGYRVAIRTQEGDIDILNDFASSDDVYTNVAPYCQENANRDGSASNFANVVQDVRCTVSINQLRRVPYSLEQRESIACRVIAINQRGQSEAGYGDGAFMPRIRTVPTAPIDVETVLMSDLRRVRVQWQQPQDNGGWDIQGYEVAIRVSNAGNFGSDRYTYRVATGNCEETQESPIRNGRRL